MEVIDLYGEEEQKVDDVHYNNLLGMATFATPRERYDYYGTQLLDAIHISDPALKPIRERLEDFEFLTEITKDWAKSVYDQFRRYVEHEVLHDEQVFWIFLAIIWNDNFRLFTQGGYNGSYVTSVGIPRRYVINVNWRREDDHYYDTLKEAGLALLKRSPSSIGAYRRMWPRYRGDDYTKATYVSEMVRCMNNFEVELFADEAIPTAFTISKAMPIKRFHERIFNGQHVYAVPIIHAQAQSFCNLLNVPTSAIIRTSVTATEVKLDFVYTKDDYVGSGHMFAHLYPNIHIKSGENKGTSEQAMDKFVKEPKLKHGPSPDKSLPQVKGSKKTGVYHYNVTLPVKLKTRTLMEGQVKTLEFMADRESKSFAPYLGRVQKESAEKVAFVTPYTGVAYKELSTEVYRNLSTQSGGIIADQTGTGKTLACLSRCTMDPENRSLIIVPDVLVHHWSSEVHKHFNLSVWEDKSHLNDAGDKDAANRKKRAKVDKMDPRATEVVVLHRTSCVRRFNWANDNAPHIMITSHSALRSKPFPKDIPFTRIMIDEGHQISDGVFSRVRELKRQFTWIVSATPYSNPCRITSLLQLPPFLDLKEMEQYKYTHLTIRNKLDQTHLKIKHVMEYCSMTTEERAFFKEAHDIIRDKVKNRYNDVNVVRLVRLLERMGAGGYMHRKLTLRIIEKAFFVPQRHSWGSSSSSSDSGGIVATKVATKKAFCGANDECAVCTCPYVKPLQLKCGHVVCTDCLTSMMEMNMRQCPYCRAVISAPYFMPKWSSDAKKAEEEEEKKRADPPEEDEEDDQPFVNTVEKQMAKAAEAEHVDQAAYKQALRGVRSLDALGKPEDFIQLQGKNIAMAKRLDKFKEDYKDDAQLVIFMKEDSASNSYHKTLTEKGFTVLCAGVMGNRRKVSVANIEKFRQGEARVLLISNKYCAGFDLFMAKETWLLNTDIVSATMAQSEGRITRVGQKYAEVIIRVFMFRNTFDNFLWKFRKVLGGKKGKGNFTKNGIYLFNYFVQSTTPGTAAYIFEEVLRKVKYRKEYGLNISDIHMDGPNYVRVHRAKLNMRDGEVAGVGINRFKREVGDSLAEFKNWFPH